MPRYALAAIAALLLLEPVAAVAAPNPKLCLALRKRFDACETYQIKHSKPVEPRCKPFLIAMKKAHCG